MEGFYDAVQKRRSVYALTNVSTVSDGRIYEIIENGLKNAPSSFNSQSARVVLLLGESHKKFWDIVLEVLKAKIPAEAFSVTENKIKGSFQSGYGTVLYFEDEDVVRGLQEKFPPYKDNFPIWSHQSNGMLQFIVWTSLAAEGMGASLQHYNPIIDGRVREVFGIPLSWKLIAQMPFGKEASPAGEKTHEPFDNRIKVFK